MKQKIFLGIGSCTRMPLIVRKQDHHDKAFP